MSGHPSLFSPPSLRKRAWFAAGISAIALLSACASDQSGVAGPSSVGDASHAEPAVLASPGWQKTARDLVAEANFSPLAAGRAYPLLGVAQYLAVQRAEVAQGGNERLEADRGAVAGASVAV